MCYNPLEKGGVLVTDKANKLLAVLLERYEQTKKTEFPAITLSDYSDDIIKELERNDYITRKSTILMSVVLTDKALAETNN